MKAARLARLHAATDREFGQKIAIYPRAGGGYVADGIDTTRSMVETVGYVTRVPDATDASGKTATDANALVRVASNTVKFITQSVPYDVRENDRVAFVDQEGRPTFRVSRAAPFGTDRTVLFMVPLTDDP